MSTAKTKAERHRDICRDVLNFNKNCNEDYEACTIFQSLFALPQISRGILYFHRAQLIRSPLVPWARSHLVRPMSHVPIKLLINVCLFLFPWSLMPLSLLSLFIKLCHKKTLMKLDSLVTLNMCKGETGVCWHGSDNSLKKCCN